MGASLTISELSKRYGSTRALDALSLDVKGEWHCLGIVGRNGAGKTTLLKAIVGLLEPDGGEILLRIGGEYYARAGAKHAVYIAEEQTLVESLTGRQHLGMFSAFNAAQRVETDYALREELVDALALDEHLSKSIVNMSKGTRRKLEVVAAFSSRIPLVVADELSEGLDVPSMNAVSEAIQICRRTGLQFIVSSHDISFMATVCDYLSVIDHGRCVDLFRNNGDLVDARNRIVSAFSASEDSGAP